MCLAPASPNTDILEVMIANAQQPVILNIYELGETRLVSGINTVTQGFLSQGGLFHAGIEVIGREVSFGAQSNTDTGVFFCHPRRCASHTYRESIYLGDSGKSLQEVKRILHSLQAEWPGQQYNAFHRNCCHFAVELAHRLGVGE